MIDQIIRHEWPSHTVAWRFALGQAIRQFRLPVTCPAKQRWWTAYSPFAAEKTETPPASAHRQGKNVEVLPGGQQAVVADDGRSDGRNPRKRGYSCWPERRSASSGSCASEMSLPPSRRDEVLGEEPFDFCPWNADDSSKANHCDFSPSNSQPHPRY